MDCRGIAAEIHLNPAVFRRFDNCRAEGILQRSVVMRKLYTSPSLAALNFHNYCQKVILDVPEYLAACRDQPYCLASGIPAYSDITTFAPQHSFSNSDCSDAISWLKNGYLYKSRFFSSDLCITALEQLRQSQHDWNVYNYSHLASLLDFYCSPALNSLLASIAGVEPVLYMSLHNLRTTARSWHQDEFLCRTQTVGSSFAVWIALDDISPDMGPLCILPGSHRLPILDKGKLDRYLARGPDLISTATDSHALSNKSAAITVPVYESMTAGFDFQPLQYLPKQGDVLVFHSRLLHRACRASVDSNERPAIIGHYCSLNEIPTTQRLSLKKHGAGLFAEET